MADVEIDRDTGVVVARMVGLTEDFTRACLPLLIVARSLAAQHVDTAAYIHSLGIERIKGKKGVTDRSVYSNDPQAHIIEAGHMQSSRKGLHFVEGQHILRRAAAAAVM